MPFFLFIPFWLGVLTVAAGLALVRVTRVLAVYLAVSSTSALAFSLLLSTAASVALDKVSNFVESSPSWAGWLFLAAYGASIVIGGLLGGLLGVFLVRRVVVRRRRNHVA